MLWWLGMVLVGPSSRIIGWRDAGFGRDSVANQDYSIHTIEVAVRQQQGS
jgi:hypothetical protein